MLYKVVLVSALQRESAMYVYVSPLPIELPSDSPMPFQVTAVSLEPGISLWSLRKIWNGHPGDTIRLGQQLTAVDKKSIHPDLQTQRGKERVGRIERVALTYVHCHM